MKKMKFVAKLYYQDLFNFLVKYYISPLKVNNRMHTMYIHHTITFLDDFYTILFAFKISLVQMTLHFLMIHDFEYNSVF